jgi:hypothetical protein
MKMRLDYTDELESELVLIPQVQELSRILLNEDIKVQLENPFETKNDFVETFDQQCEEMVEEDDFDSDTIKQVEEERVEFYIKVINMLDEKFQLNCDTDYISQKSVVDINDICSALYNFFVIRRKKTIKNMVLNYIIENENEIVKTLEIYKDNKDVSTLSNNIKIEDENIALIVTNIEEVISYFKSLNISMDEMINYSDLDLFNNAMVKELIDDSVISPDFQVLYFSPIYSFKDTHYDEIISKIEHDLIKVAKKRRIP